MKKIFFLLAVVLFVYRTDIQAQHIDFSRFGLGAGISYNFPENDLGKFWKNSKGISLVSTYDIGDMFNLEAELHYTELTRKQTENLIPDIKIYIISGGICYRYQPIPVTAIVASAGLQSYTFKFFGSYFEKSGNNSNESEMGFYFSAGLRINILNRISVIPLFKIQNILSDPEIIVIKSYAFRIIYHI